MLLTWQCRRGTVLAGGHPLDLPLAIRPCRQGLKEGANICMINMWLFWPFRAFTPVSSLWNRPFSPAGSSIVYLPRGGRYYRYNIRLIVSQCVVLDNEQSAGTCCPCQPV